MQRMQHDDGFFGKLAATSWVIAISLGALTTSCIPPSPPKAFETGDGRRYALLDTRDLDAIAAGERCDAGDAVACRATGRELERAGARDHAITVYRRACEGDVREACDDWRRVRDAGLSVDLPRLLRAAEGPSPAAPAAPATSVATAAPPPPAAPAASPAPASPAPPAVTVDRLTTLLAKSKWSDEEGLELTQAAGILGEMGGMPPTTLRVERAQLDDSPGEEAVLFASSAVAIGAAEGVAVFRTAGGKSSVIYRAEGMSQHYDAGPLRGVNEWSFRLTPNVEPGTSLLEEAVVERILEAAPNGAVKTTSTHTWTLRSFRGSGPSVVLEATATTLDTEMLWMLAPRDGKLVRLDPGGKAVESWTWDAANNRFTGSGPNGKWWQKPPSKARSGKRK